MDKKLELDILKAAKNKVDKKLHTHVLGLNPSRSKYFIIFSIFIYIYIYRVGQKKPSPKIENLNIIIVFF